MGRFLQRDPLDYTDGMNMYQYVYNSSPNWVDPYGLSAQYKLVKLLEKGSMKVIGIVRSKAAAVAARLKGKNILAPTKQAGRELEKAAAGGRPIIRHPGHDLPNGGQGRPHYQTPGQPGHTFWSGLGPFLLDFFDPFDPDALDDEDADLDGNGIPDWMDQYGDPITAKD